MTHAGETVGRTVNTGLRSLRRNAARAGQAGADAATRAASVAEQKLTEQGIAPQRLAEAVSENAGMARDELVRSTRRARKKLARNAEQTRKDLARSAKQARKLARKRAGEAADTATRAFDEASAGATQVGRKATRASRKAANKAAAKATRAANKAGGRAGRRATKALENAQRKLAKADAKAAKRAGRGRRWPWLLGLGVAAAGTAYVVRKRSAASAWTEPAPSAFPGDVPAPGSPSTNGDAPGSHQHDEVHNKS